MRKNTKDKKRFKSREARRKYMLRIKSIVDVNNLNKQQSFELFKTFVEDNEDLFPDKMKEIGSIDELEDDEIEFMIRFMKYLINIGFSLGVNSEHISNSE